MKGSASAAISVLVIVISAAAAFSVFADWASETVTVSSSLLGSTAKTGSGTGLDVAGKDFFTEIDSGGNIVAVDDWHVYVPYAVLAIAALTVIACAAGLARGSKGAGSLAAGTVLGLAGAGVTAAFVLWDRFGTSEYSILGVKTVYDVSPEFGAWMALACFALVFILSLAGLAKSASGRRRRRCPCGIGRSPGRPVRDADIRPGASARFYLS